MYLRNLKVQIAAVCYLLPYKKPKESEKGEKKPQSTPDCNSWKIANMSKAETTADSSSHMHECALDVCFLVNCISSRLGRMPLLRIATSSCNDFMARNYWYTKIHEAVFSSHVTIKFLGNVFVIFTVSMLFAIFANEIGIYLYYKSRYRYHSTYYIARTNSSNTRICVTLKSRLLTRPVVRHRHRMETPSVLGTFAVGYFCVGSSDFWGLYLCAA